MACARGAAAERLGQPAADAAKRAGGPRPARLHANSTPAAFATANRTRRAKICGKRQRRWNTAPAIARSVCFNSRTIARPAKTQTANVSAASPARSAVSQHSQPVSAAFDRMESGAGVVRRQHLVTTLATASPIRSGEACKSASHDPANIRAPSGRQSATSAAAASFPLDGEVGRRCAVRRGESADDRHVGGKGRLGQG